jgi:hypothetical protein
MIAEPVQDSEFDGNRYSENLEGADQAVEVHQVASEPEQPADRAVEEIHEQFPVGEMPGDQQPSHPSQPATDGVSGTDSEHNTQEDVHHEAPIPEGISPETPVQEAQSSEADLKLPDHSAENLGSGEEAILFEPYYTIDYLPHRGFVFPRMRCPPTGLASS